MNQFQIALASPEGEARVGVVTDFATGGVTVLVAPVEKAREAEMAEAMSAQQQTSCPTFTIRGNAVAFGSAGTHETGGPTFDLRVRDQSKCPRGH